MAPTNGGVTVAANGALSGYAWGSGLGWINFSGVSINSSGKFISQANGTIIGTLTFDCTNCNVSTDYRPSNFRTVTTPTPSPSGGGGGGGGISGLIGTTNGTPATNPNEQEAAPAGGEIVGSQSKDTDPVFRADINDNGGVGVLDFNILMIHWGETGAGSVADINLDGSVDVFDFNILMVDWGKVYNAQLKTYE